MPDSLTDRAYFITGFPGFLSQHLVGELADRTDGPLHFLCLEDTLEAARCQLDELAADHPKLADRAHLHAGDIAAPKLGLGDELYDELASEVGVVWHLAALYDLSVAEEIAYRVNVAGTVNVLDFCEACDDFERLNYVSTCYVAGERIGPIYENELDVGQHHHNHYEATKFWAEVEVQRRCDDIPTAIFRPSIVVGHSRTGHTAKYDGPYFLFQLLHRLPEWMPVPSVGSGDSVVNLVPVDFAARALARLGTRPGTEDRVYHLADPHPLTARQIVDRVLEAMDRPPTKGRLPARWVERALENSTVEQWAGIPREALRYFNHDARFDTTNADRALGEVGLECPPLPAYLGRLVDFYLRHPEGPPNMAAKRRD